METFFSQMTGHNEQPQICFCCTTDKLGRICNKTSNTLEPWDGWTKEVLRENNWIYKYCNKTNVVNWLKIKSQKKMNWTKLAMEKQPKTFNFPYS